MRKIDEPRDEPGPAPLTRIPPDRPEDHDRAGDEPAAPEDWAHPTPTDDGWFPV